MRFHEKYTCILIEINKKLSIAHSSVQYSARSLCKYTMILFKHLRTSYVSLKEYDRGFETKSRLETQLFSVFLRSKLEEILMKSPLPFLTFSIMWSNSKKNRKKEVKIDQNMFWCKKNNRKKEQ